MTFSSYDLSVVIVSWNVKLFLKECLCSIKDETPNLNYEIIVVDNASQDGSVEMIKKEFPGVKLIVNSQNLGFAKAVNQGVKESSGNYIALLNPDVRILDKALEKTLTFMKEKPKVRVTGCRLENPDGSLQPSVRSFPSLFSISCILLKIHYLFPYLRALKKYLALDFNYQETQKVDQVMGAFMMVRREILNQVGYFDEGYYLWFEEVDFCKRVKNNGGEIWYFSQARIRHEKAQSFKQVLKIKKQYYFFKSARRYFKKYHSFGSQIILLLIFLPSLFLSFIIQLFYEPR